MRRAFCASQRSPCDLGPVRLAVDHDAVELERGVAAEDEPVDRLAVDARAPTTASAFSLREQLHQLGGVERAGLRLAAATTASSSTPGAMAIGLDPGGAQGREPGGRRRGEVQAHAPSCRSGSRCGMLDHATRPRRDGRRRSGDRRPRDRARRRADVAHGGVFVARHEGRVVFVADAIPGERVVGARHRRRRTTGSGGPRRVAVLEPRPHRQRARLGRGLRRTRTRGTAPAAPSSVTSSWPASAR